jgi:hypothetical protein
MVADAVPTTMLEPSKATAKAAILKLAIATPSFSSLLANAIAAQAARIPRGGCKDAEGIVGKC